MITYNGEVYNFRELRPELEAQRAPLPLADRHRGRPPRLRGVGPGLRSSASTACSRSRSGTRRTRELFLARDRLGIKPLYYAMLGGTLALRAPRSRLCSRPACRAGSQPAEALNEYFTFQNIFTRPDALRRRPAAARRPHPAPTRRRPRTERYWDLAFEPDESVRDEEWVRGAPHRLFSEAVTRQLVSDVPVGSYLSGGMDSGSIAAVASRAVPRL